MPRLRILALLVCVVLAGSAGGDVLGGSITVHWDPVSDPDLAGYRLYYGNSSGGYSQSMPVGNSTVATISGLNDCATYYIALKSIDLSGMESPQFSSEISGFTQPTLSTVSPALILAGTTATLTLDGMSFESGATLAFSRSGLTVESVTVESCTRILVSLTAAVGMATGPVDVSVVNPGDVPGSLTGGLTVTLDVLSSDVSNLHRTDVATGP